MVAATDSAFDLCVLEVGLLLLHLALILGAGFPVRYRPEDDVLCDAGGVGLWALGLSLLLTKFRQVLPLCDSGVHSLLDGGLFDAPCGLDLLPIIADRVGYDGFGSVFVLGDLGLRKLERVLVLLFGPVGAAVKLVSAPERRQKSKMLTQLLETF